MSDPSPTQTQAAASVDPAQTSESESPETAKAAVTTETNTEETNTDDPSFGWNAYAERTNGRFAMVGFIALLLLELFTHQDFWTWIGLSL